MTRSLGTTTSSKNSSANSASPLIARRGRTVTPGLSMSTNRAVMPRWASSAVPVRARRMQRRAYWAQLVQTFWPLTRQVSPSSTARSRNEARSLPASGSENPWHHASSPRSSGGRAQAAMAGAKRTTAGASTSIIPKEKGGGQPAAASSSDSTPRSSEEPPSPPSSSGQPHRSQPASKRSRCSSPSTANWPSRSVGRRRKRSRSAAWPAIHRPNSARNVARSMSVESAGSVLRP